MEEIRSEDFLKHRELARNLTPAESMGGSGIVIFMYLMLVVKIIPTFMMNRKPFAMKRLILFYDAFQVVFSAYMVYIYAEYIWRYGIFPTRCPQNNPKIIGQVINSILPYFIAKHIDLLDTVFFRLRKKDSQVSFLHLYHHSIMIAWAWLYYMYLPTDHFVVTGLLNSFVHVLLYAYYAISSLGPRFTKYLRWKKHLTKIQLVQFVLAASNLYYQQKITPCPLPNVFHYFAIFTILSFLLLFADFYFKNYKRSKKTQDLGNKKNDINAKKLDEIINKM